MNKPVFFMAIWLLALTALPVHAFAACALNKALYRPMEKSPDNVYYELTHSTQKKLRANQADLVLTINSPNDSKSFKPGVGRSYDYGFLSATATDGRTFSTPAKAQKARHTISIQKPIPRRRARQSCISTTICAWWNL